MNRGELTLFTSVALTLAVPLFGTQTTPLRRADPAPPAPASINGHVLSEGGRGVWGATVVLALPDTGSTRTALTDERGQFSFSRVPPGRVNVAATKSGFFGGGVGQARGEPPLDLVLDSGQALEGVTVRLITGAVVSGTVRDPTGAPTAGISVSALERRELSGVTRFVRGNGAITDDQGRFRIFGLAPGAYLVAASMATFQAAAGGLVPSEEMRMAPQALPAASALAHVFAPGTVDPREAVLLTVASGDQIGGVDLALVAVPVGEVSTPLITESAGMSGLQAILAAAPDTPSLGLGEPRSRPIPLVGGRFSPRVQPGTYTLVVRATSAAGPPRDNGPAAPRPTWPDLWSVTTVDVPAAGVRLLPPVVLRLGSPVEGRVTVGAGSPPIDLSSLALRLSPQSRRAPRFDLPPVPVAADGQFRIPGLPDGTYFIDVAIPLGSRARVSAARAGSTDLIDLPLVVAGAAQSGIEIVITEAPSSTSSWSLSQQIPCAGRSNRSGFDPPCGLRPRGSSDSRACLLATTC
jgi:Carboxypeptidase regulatory-like domain